MFNYFHRKNYLKLVLRVLIGLLVYFVLITLLIHFEKHSDQSVLTDYTNAIWYSVVTLTTVGYGDVYPTTIFGRLIGYIFIFLSLGMYGILIGEITTTMSNIKENIKLGYKGTDFMNHTVILGWNEFGKQVADQLMGVDRLVAIVTDNRENVDIILEKYDSRNVFTLFSDFQNFDLIKNTNIHLASTVFINLEDDTEKLVYLLDIKKHFPELDYVVTLDNGNLKETFISAGAKYAVSKHDVASKLLASYMFEPDVALFSESIMSFAKHDADYDIKQFLVTDDNVYLNKLYNDVFLELKQKYNSVLIGISKIDKYGERRLIKNPAGEIKVSLGDYLIIIVNGKAFKMLQKEFNVDEGYFKEEQS